MIKNHIFRPVVAIMRFFFSFQSIKIILYNSRGGVLDEEVSTSKLMLEHSTFILGVWVKHVMIHKIIQPYMIKNHMFRPVVAIIRFFFLSFDSLNIILYNSRGGVLDEEVSTSKLMLEHSTFLLGVWVKHVMIHKNI